MAWTFETLKPPSVAHILNKATPTNPSQIVVPTGDHTFKHKLVGTVSFQSFLVLYSYKECYQIGKDNFHKGDQYRKLF